MREREPSHWRLARLCALCGIAITLAVPSRGGAQPRGTLAGVVRDSEGQASISAIDYEAFQKMAEHQFGKIFDDIAKRWPVESIRLIHRIGIVRVNEPSLWVEVIAPHRGEAFAACQFLIDEMKKTVPIWKRPVSVDRATSSP